MRPALKDLKPVLASGQVLLVGRRGPFAWAIKRVTASPYTHAAVVDVTQAGVWVVVEAVAGGVAGRRLEHYVEDPHYSLLCLRAIPGLSAGDRARVCEAAWLQVGQGYDVPGLVGIYVKRRLGYRAPTFYDIEGRKFCSEAASWAYKTALGIDLVPGEVPGLTSPGDLAETAVLHDVWRWQEGEGE